MRKSREGMGREDEREVVAQEEVVKLEQQGGAEGGRRGGRQGSEKKEVVLGVCT